MEFKDRDDAGRILAEHLVGLKHDILNPVVLAIPRGGIPVAYAVARALNVSLDVVPIRKLPIPDNPGAGFGAMTLNNMIILNQHTLSALNLSVPQINRIIDDVFDEILKRDKLYRKDKPLPDLQGRSAILVDDALVSGYTMLAAMRMLRRSGVENIIAAVPVAHKTAYDLLSKEADNVIAFHVSSAPLFGEASFYKNFSDVCDEEAMAYLNKRREEMKFTVAASSGKRDAALEDLNDNLPLAEENAGIVREQYAASTILMGNEL